MRGNRIGRNVKVTTCKGEYYDEENVKREFEVSIYGGHYDLFKLTRKVRRKLNNERFLIDSESVRYTDFWASMPLETFLKYADITERN